MIAILNGLLYGRQVDCITIKFAMLNSSLHSFGYYLINEFLRVKCLYTVTCPPNHPGGIANM